MPTFLLRFTSLLLVAYSMGGSLPTQRALPEPPQVPTFRQSAHIEVIHGRPYVMVFVNGRGPYRFIIDTGTSGAAFVSPQLADDLGLPPAGETHLTDPSRLGGLRVPTVLVSSLKVAGVEFNGVKALRHVLNDADGNCDGLLGFALFRSFLLTLDYPAHTMTLASGALNPDEGRSILPFRTPDGTPIVRMRVGNLSGVETQIDSGGGGLSLPQGVASRLRFSSAPQLFSDAQTLSTKFQLKGAQLAADISLGGYTFKRPFVEINPAFPRANLGGCPMQNFSFTFDQRNGLVRIAARTSTLHLSASPSAAMRLDTAPTLRPVDPSLVPVG